MAKSYYEKLKDPRWQKLRLEIMQRDGFACQKCGDKTTTLNVHHRFYRKGAEPWEYWPEHLQTLCEVCHKDTTETLADVYQQVGMLSHEQLESLFCLLPTIYGLFRAMKKPDACLTGWLIDIEEHFEGLLNKQLTVKIIEQKPEPRDEPSFGD